MSDESVKKSCCCCTVCDTIMPGTGRQLLLAKHYSGIIMSEMASQITGALIVYPTVCSSADQRRYQSSASLAFVRGIHRSPARSPVNSPHKGPVTRKCFHLMTSPWETNRQFYWLMFTCSSTHDESMTRKRFPHCWPFARKSTVTGRFPSQRSSNGRFDVFSDDKLNNLLDKSWVVDDLGRHDAQVRSLYCDAKCIQFLPRGGGRLCSE